MERLNALNAANLQQFRRARSVFSRKPSSNLPILNEDERSLPSASTEDSEKSSNCHSLEEDERSKLVSEDVNSHENDQGMKNYKKDTSDERGDKNRLGLMISENCDLKNVDSDQVNMLETTEEDDWDGDLRTFMNYSMFKETFKRRRHATESDAANQSRNPFKQGYLNLNKHTERNDGKNHEKQASACPKTAKQFGIRSNKRKGLKSKIPLQENHSRNVGPDKAKTTKGPLHSEQRSQSTAGRRLHQRLILTEDSDDENAFSKIEESSKDPAEIDKHSSLASALLCLEDEKTQMVKGKLPIKQTEILNNPSTSKAVQRSLKTTQRQMLYDVHFENDDDNNTSQKMMWKRQRRSSHPPHNNPLGVDIDDEFKKEGGSEDSYEEGDASRDDDIEIFDRESGTKKKRGRCKNEAGNSYMDEKKEVHLTTRQKAIMMHSSREIHSDVEGGLLEFPDGLPQTKNRRTKEKLSDIAQQLKKAEAAEKRRIEAQKASKAIQDKAIQKILGKESSMRKQDTKSKKKSNKDQEKNGVAIPLNTVRVVMGPTGTVVSFSEDVGLPSIFKSGTSRYPPQHEKCAGPSCSNPYTYRDPKTKLPLCSLKCYRAVNGISVPKSS